VALPKHSVVSLEPIAETDEEGHFRFTRHGRHRVVRTASKRGVGASDRLEVRHYFRDQNRELEEPLQLSPLWSRIGAAPGSSLSDCPSTPLPTYATH
jgi:hypothetical protein